MKTLGMNKVGSTCHNRRPSVGCEHKILSYRTKFPLHPVSFATSPKSSALVHNLMPASAQIKYASPHDTSRGQSAPYGLLVWSCETREDAHTLVPGKRASPRASHDSRDRSLGLTLTALGTTPRILLRFLFFFLKRFLATFVCAPIPPIPHEAIRTAANAHPRKNCIVSGCDGPRTAQTQVTLAQKPCLVDRRTSTPRILSGKRKHKQEKVDPSQRPSLQI